MNSVGGRAEGPRTSDRASRSGLPRRQRSVIRWGVRRVRSEAQRMSSPKRGTARRLLRGSVGWRSISWKVRRGKKATRTHGSTEVFRALEPFHYSLRGREQSYLIASCFQKYLIRSVCLASVLGNTHSDQMGSTFSLLQ